MVWIIMAHRYMLFLISVANPRIITQHLGDWRYWWVFNAYPAVDTFFFISAFLVSAFLKTRLKEFSFTTFYLQRYLRLVPAMMYVTWGCSSVLRHLGSGPVWHSTYHTMFGRPCATTGWTNMLLINNFNHSDDMCLGHLWSLAVEWQLFVVAPLLLLPYYRWHQSQLGRLLPFCACLSVTLLLPAALTLLHHLPPTPSFSELPATRMYYSVYYTMPWCRAGSYLVGLAAGCLYHTMIAHDLTLTPACVRACGWACVVVVVGVLVSPSFIPASGTYWAALYSSLARPAWAGALTFFVISTVRGRPGVLAWLASRQVWAPLGRLSYSVFLVSVPLQTFSATANPHKMHYHHLTASNVLLAKVYLVLGDVVLSCLAGLLLLLLVEAPSASLLQLLASHSTLRHQTNGKLRRYSVEEMMKSNSVSTTPIMEGEATSASTTPIMEGEEKATSHSTTPIIEEGEEKATSHSTTPIMEGEEKATSHSTTPIIEEGEEKATSHSTTPIMEGEEKATSHSTTPIIEEGEEEKATSHSTTPIMEGEEEKATSHSTTPIMEGEEKATSHSTTPIIEEGEEEATAASTTAILENGGKAIKSAPTTHITEVKKTSITHMPLTYGCVSN
nr:O-acyltransferase like protein-like [Cherax quadricarinatus]